MSDTPVKTWREIAMELLATNNPKTVERLAAELVAAFDREEGHRDRTAAGSMKLVSTGEGNTAWPSPASKQ